MRSNTQLLTRVCFLVLWIIIICAGLYVLTVYLYPFLIGLLLSLIFLPFVNFLENKFGWHRSAAVFLVISSFIFLFFAAFTLLIAEIAAGLNHLTKSLPGHIEDGFYKLHEWFDTTVLPVYERLLAFTRKLSNEEQQMPVDSQIESLLTDLGSQAGSVIQYFLNNLAELILSLPNALTVFFFALLASFFITKDWPVMMEWLNSKIHRKIKKLAGNIIFHLKQAVTGYALAQFILVSITGIIVLTGLLILQIKYAVTAALLIALVDLFPYLGTGLIFIPWVLYSFFSGEWSLSIGLSVLYAIVIIQRQLAEPKIISRHIGIPPLALLITLFLSYQIFGVLGLLMGPALFIIAQSLIKAGVIEEIGKYIKDGARKA